MPSKSKITTRGRAAAVHLALSVSIAASVFAAVYFIWYPGGLFAAAGGRDLFMLIACVDVVIGPLITLVIFVHGKKGLLLDLVVIALLQASALAYGVWVLYESRPAWIVFVKDRFELVRANYVLEPELRHAKPPFDRLSADGPKLAGARMPADPNEQLRIAVTAASGFDLASYPQYLVPYDEVKASAAERGLPMQRLWDLNPQRHGEIARIRSRIARPDAGARYLPMRAGKNDLAVVLDAVTGDVLDIAALRPWEY